MVIDGLRALQHRGQEAWGIALPGSRPFRWLGLITDEIQAAQSLSESAKSEMAIGHTRYSTVGSTVFENVQPIQIGEEFSIAHNGTISDTSKIEKIISKEFDIPEWASDTTIIGLRLMQILRENNGKWFESFSKLSKEISGAYCFVILTKNKELFAVRDENGFRPLCIGWNKKNQTHVIASESCALSMLDAELVRDVKPGEIIKIDGKNIRSHIFKETNNHAHCSFEYTYFAHPSSTIENVNVYQARKNVGKILAELYKVKGDVVIPVPDSARPAALGFSEASRIPIEEGLMKDRYGKRGGLRSFIEPEQKERVEINRRIIAIEQTVRNKEIILIDDSIVRGTSSKRMIETLKKAGAKKIKLLVTFPPLRYPCYAGIDFPTSEELIVNNVTDNNSKIEEINEKLSQELGIEFVGYNTLEGLSKGLKMAKNELCTSCVTGDYSCLDIDPQYTDRMKK
jgi:amidophosphoribosyltransferase